MIKGVEGGPDELFSGWRGVRPIDVWRGLLSLLAGKEFPSQLPPIPHESQSFSTFPI